MAISINDGGTWRELQGVYVNDAGTWRSIQEVYVNDAGTWRSVFTSESVTLSGNSVAARAITTGDATAVYRLGSDGVILRTTDNTNTTANAGFWITPQVNMANYEARFDLTSGTLNGGTSGAWQSLATNRQWVKVRVRSSEGTGLSQCSGTLQVRRAADAVVVASVTLSLGATNL